MTDQPRRSRDAFIALRTDDYYEAVRDIRHESPELTERLRNLFLEITLAVVTTGLPLSPDDRIAAMSVLRSISTYRAQRARLLALGLVYKAECGGWLTRLAEAEFSRRAARQKSGEGAVGGAATGAARGAATHPLNSENSNDCKGGLSPLPLTQPHKSEDIKLPLQQDPAREEGFNFDLKGVGLGRVERDPLPEAQRDAARALNVSTVEPLLGPYRRWQRRQPPEKRAKDVDAHFVAAAPSLFENAKPSVRAACGPIATEPIVARPAVASPSLLASISGRRHARH